MRGPADKHSEIVAEIIKCVKCPPEVTPFIERIARRLIRDLRDAPEPFSGNQKENIEFAQKLCNDITRLEHTLKGAPKNPFALSVLFEERFSGVWWDTRATLFEINANAKRYIAQERSHQSRFAEELSRVRAQCDKIISLGPGEHGRTKHQHAAAAKASFIILREVANYTGTKLELGCAPTSRFVGVARLFHEAVTDEYEADLVWACKTLKASLDAKS